MLLVIDIGNTNTVFGLYRGEELLVHWRIQTHRRATSDELGVLYRHLFSYKGIEVDDIDAAIIGSVVPPVEHPMKQMIQNYFGIEPVFIGKDVDAGMPIEMVDPKTVGADRIVNAVAAWERFHQPLVVVDFGTATTFDAISAKGTYLGGAIAPGVGVSSEALFHAASKLPRVDFAKPSHVIGSTTVEAIQSGLWYGYVGLVKELVKRTSEALSSMDKSEKKAKVAVVATGGLAFFIERETDIIDLVDPFLTLDGLRIIWHRTQKRL